MAELTKRDILDQLLLMCEEIRAAFKHIDHSLDNIKKRCGILKNASPQAPALAIINDEAPSDEPSCKEQLYDDEPSDNEPCDELYNKPYEEPC
jgi:hypothetical protein